jgi:succinate dehydrogenase / fumarate reductase, iron-sulfur subunit
MKPGQTFELRIQRQAGPGKPSFWESFTLTFVESMNIISALQEIQKNPVNARGKATTPVTWECSCLEEVCGACSMRINGKARQSCTALVADLPTPITLQPLEKFPVIRDLMVDRSSMFEALKKIKAWIPIDGTHVGGPGPRLNPDEQQTAYPLSRCMTCGCCVDSCPQVNPRSNFIGPAAISQARLFNIHPTGRTIREERLRALMGPGGVTDCGNAQNCVRACPKNIPLTTSIAEINRQTTLLAIFGRLKHF